MMRPHRLRAPSTDGELLAEPPLDQVPARLDANRRRLAAWDHDFQGRRAGRLRQLARRELLARAAEFHRRHGLDPAPAAAADPDRPLIVTGHQPELFHPGVWAKNFAAGALASAAGGRALNLIVDNDIPHRHAIRVPERTGAGLRTVLVDFASSAGDVPYEDGRVRDEDRFRSFPGRVRAALGDLVPDPVLDEFWPLVERAAGDTDRLGLRFALARHGLERAWGLANAEVPASAGCESEAFLWFVGHLLAQLPRFQEVHNAALARYRAAYGIRSRRHPVPALGAQGEWREAPFWVWRAAAPRRRPLLVRQLARTMELRIPGEDSPFLELPLAPDREACCAVERLRELPARGIRLRTRALTTTLFARLLVGDLFIHGIGGAKYDEVGDEIARGFFGIEPPGFLTLSMTLWLGLAEDPATLDRLRAVQHLRRDLTYNPDRHLDPPLTPDQQALIAAKRRAIAGPVETRRQRVARFAEIRRLNDRLREPLRPRFEALAADEQRLRAGVRRNRIARDRDYAFVLHSRRRLRSVLARATPESLPG